ncbi:cytochrome P450 76A2-like [Olea europaea var. sylvestris]|uniref:cytochrome P450 76A2-like n=1 Tax=Olea europaea var. sylvestris TaxID=158386 RepID=UPI000C1D6043|nr:cytochrome P450 76A2-like [Olea europaea var. sylvestris]
MKLRYIQSTKRGSITRTYQTLPDMDLVLKFFVWCIVILAPALVLLRQRMKSKSMRLPPGPPGWPVFGNMFQLGAMPHKTIANLRKEYGPVVWFRIGSINTMAVLTAKAATELFKNHDITFVERTITEVMKSNGFNKAALSLAPYGAYWRVMKRIMTVEMLVNKRINETVSIRQRCINDMIQWIEKESDSAKESGGIHLARFVFLASFNMLGNLMLSRDLVDPQSEEGSEFFTAMMGLMEWSGHPNIVDLFPWLKWLDPQGLKRKMDRDQGITLKVVAGFVAERLKERQDGKEKKDYLEVLLQFEGNGKDEPEKISNHALNIIIMEVFLAGSETTSSTIEWVMVELLSHPETMIKVKNELAEVIGKNNKFEEKYIENLPYLQAVVKETLRLHPPIPFLVPRKATQDTDFMGYHIPKNTQVFVNAWAIGRDSDCWDEPSSFKPERFLGSKIDYKGQHFELIPFGAGRRICAGIPLAHRMLHLVLGSLLHEFDWEIDEIARNDIMDTRERIGVTVRKMLPLKAIPIRCMI